jgi:hypothetical protein
MNSNAESLENLPDPFALEVPCCGEGSALAEAAGELPDLATLQQELDLLVGQTGPAAEDLLLADLGTEELTFQQELELAGLTNPPLPPLEQILEIAERYPGLKVTFSF